MSRKPSFLTLAVVVESNDSVPVSRGVGSWQHAPDRRQHRLDLSLVSSRHARNRQRSGVSRDLCSTESIDSLGPENSHT